MSSTWSKLLRYDGIGPREDFGDLGARDIAIGTTWSEPEHTLEPGQSFQLSLSGSQAIQSPGGAG